MTSLLHRPPGRDAIKASCTKSCVNIDTGRRHVFLGLAGVLAVSLVQPAHARVEAINKEADAQTSPYIQELLRRTEENREQRSKERLQDYYKRNFKDYFEFEGGDPRTGRARGINPDTQAAIQRWLEANK